MWDVNESVEWTESIANKKKKKNGKKRPDAKQPEAEDIKNYHTDSRHRGQVIMVIDRGWHILKSDWNVDNESPRKLGKTELANKCWICD